MNDYKDNLDVLKEIAIHSYKSIYSKYSSELESYINCFNDVLSYLYVSEKDIMEFKGSIEKYVNSIKQNVNLTEKFLLFYHGLCFSEVGELINKFCLIDNLPKEDLLDERHETFYKCRMKLNN